MIDILEKKSPLPKYYQIKEFLCREIESSGHKPGDRFYSENEISKRFSVSPMTVRQAFRAMIDEKLVERIHGKGTFISHPYIPSEKLNSILIIGGEDVMHHLSNPFYAEILGGIQERAGNSNWKVHYYHYRETESEEIPSAVSGKEVDGVILVGRISKSFQELIVSTELPCLFVDGNFEGKHSLNPDNFGGAYRAVELLIDLGCRKIVHMDYGENGSQSAVQRRMGYSFALNEHNLDFREDMIFHGKYWFDYSMERFGEFLDSGIEFDGIFAGNDAMALAAQKHLLKRGKSVPIIGFDNIPTSRMCEPGLTTVSFDKYGMGRKAFGIINELISGGSPDIETVFDVEIIRRETT